MTSTPRSIRSLGIGQFLFAAGFVLWLLFLPNGGENFAWPVVPSLTTVFVGTSFILRTFLGFMIIRTQQWYRLRWVVWGNYMFLAIILISTFWHIAEMNWTSNIILAHVWVVIYVFEPLVLPFLGPFDEASKAPVPAELSEGEIPLGLRRVLIGTLMVTATMAGLLFISPEFMNTRWPWPLDPFNARIMAAWPAGIAVWAGTMALSKDWVEIKMGIQGFILYGGALFVAWLVTFPQYDLTRNNVWTYGIVTPVITALLAYYYWRKESELRGKRSAA